MCGRYSLATSAPRELRARFPLGESVEIARRFNVAPGDPVLAVLGTSAGPAGAIVRWGLVPFWADDPSVGLRMINARAETAAQRPAFRRAFQRHRCLVIADGFYEWDRSGAPGRPRPFHITRAGGDPFAFAGLWSTWRGADGTRLRSCAILTTVPNPAVARLHDRMPVILEPGAEEAWLDPGTPPPALRELMVALPDDAIALREVCTAVNDARYDGPRCLEDPEEPLTLFGSE